MALLGWLIPASESAAGGNYNLRYFSAATRRSLTTLPQFDPSSAGGFRHGAEYTLYIPAVGFLSSDPMMWAQKTPGRLRNSTKYPPDDQKGSWQVNEEAHRVFFGDKFLNRHPWEIREVSRRAQNGRAMHTIQPGSTVRLRDMATDRYVCVRAGEKVVSEAGYFNLDDGEDKPTSGRLQVG